MARILAIFRLRARSLFRWNTVERDLRSERTPVILVV